MRWPILIIAAIVLLMIVIIITIFPKREYFFYHTETPTWVQEAFDLKSALFMAQLSLVAYYTNINVNRITKFMHDHYLTFVPYKNIFTDENTDSSLIWATSVGNKDLYIAFRGTELTWDNLKEDLSPSLIMFPPVANIDLRTDYGFTTAWMSVRQQVFDIVDKTQPNRLYITGHSLGAALATLCAFDLKYHIPDLDPILYNFGSPRVGDYGFAYHFGKIIDKCYRIQNKNDPVPRLPTTYEDYEHVKEEILIDNDKSCQINAGLPSNWPYSMYYHEIVNYIKYIGNMISRGEQCTRYERFPKTLNYCTGGNTNPPLGYGRCVY